MFSKLQNNPWLRSQPLWFTFVRIAIGWHFLWEGWIKLANPNWTAKGYLSGAWGPLAPVLHWMAELKVEDTWILNGFITPEPGIDIYWIVSIVNFMIPWMLFIAGLGLMLGLFTRAGIVIAMALLLLFIMPTPAHPYMTLNPTMTDLQWSSISMDLEHAQWAGKHMIGMEGSYFLISKNVIELLTLIALLTFDSRKLYGMDQLLADTNITKERRTGESMKTV